MANAESLLHLSFLTILDGAQGLDPKRLTYDDDPDAGPDEEWQQPSEQGVLPQ